jgi:formylglycine-generating enzyme required for sulfatase activity
VLHAPGGASGCGLDHTQEVWVPKKVDEHPLGFRDLAGNVWEWTADWYDEAYYRATPGTTANPTGPVNGTRRVQRGGSFASTDPVELRSAYRAALEPDVRQPDVGFRCAADEVER